MDTNCREVALKIFSKPPQNHGSIQLGIETEDDAQNKSHLFAKVQITEVLAQLLIEGAKIKFGNIDLLSLEDSQIDLLKAYFLSFGFDCRILENYESTDDNEYVVNVDGSTVQIVFKNHLCDHYCSVLRK